MAKIEYIIEVTFRINVEATDEQDAKWRAEELIDGDVTIIKSEAMVA